MVLRFEEKATYPTGNLRMVRRGAGLVLQQERQTFLISQNGLIPPQEITREWIDVPIVEEADDECA